MERELFICSCENTEHQIVFSWFEDECGSDVYATIHLRKRSFWERLKYGIKYIFGYQCKYGAFDEFIFNPEDVDKLEKIVKHLKGGQKMTPSEEIKNMLIPILSSMRAHGSTEAEIIAYRNGFTVGSMWRGAHPCWISVKDELPPRDTFFNMSKIKKEHIEKFNLKDKELDTSIGCLVVIRGGMLGLSNYNYQAKAWGIACGEEITHWMPLPQAPLVTDLNKKDLPPVGWQEGNILVEEKGGEE